MENVYRMLGPNLITVRSVCFAEFSIRPNLTPFGYSLGLGLVIYVIDCPIDEFKSQIQPRATMQFMSLYKPFNSGIKIHSRLYGQLIAGLGSSYTGSCC